MIELIEYNQR